MATDPTRSMVEVLSRLERGEGILCLATQFQWREFKNDDQRLYLHQEFVYENVMYSAKRGLSWSAVAQIATSTKELLPELEGLEKFEAISMIQAQLSNFQPQLSPSHHAALLDFIGKDYVRHHQLYQAFLKGEQNLKVTHSQLEIHVPPHPLPLCEGTDVALLDKQQSLQELMAAETEKQAEIHRFREQAEEQLMAKLQGTLDGLSLENRQDKQAVESLVHTIVQSQGEVVKDILLKEMKAVQELLELRLHQKCLLGLGHCPTSSNSASVFSEKPSLSGCAKPKKK